LGTKPVSGFRNVEFVPVPGSGCRICDDLLSR
jgi:hypothetical protein